MFKKTIAMLLCLILVLGMTACGTKKKAAGNTDATQGNVPGPADTNTPEEVAKRFYLAMAEQDVDTMAELTPPYSHEVLAYVLNIPIEEGVTGKDAAKAAYAYMFGDGGMLLKVDYASIEINTRLTPEADIPGDILQGIEESYVQHEMMARETFESIEDTAWVDAECIIIKEDGSEDRSDYGEVRLICVKVDGKWYMDFLMVMTMPAQNGTADKAEPNP
ncbi:MAG: hypothetical protein J6C41_06045 [Oscillospiraceae bacterium]|nr:hypothetical protein [Oscillospiraceae bacterium]